MKNKISSNFEEVVEKGRNTEKFYTAKIDRVFKSTIGHEDNQKLLEEFLSRILKEKVSIVKYLRNEQPVDNVMEKIKIVDLLVQLETKIVHIELNNISEYILEDIQKRNFIYVASDYVDIVQRGDNYSIKTPVQAIDLTYGLGLNSDLYTPYSYQNNKGEKYVDDLETLVVNMDKAMQFWYDKDIEMVQENKHLIMLACEPEDLKSLSEGDELVKEFTDKITTLNNNKKFRQLMTAEEDSAKLERTRNKRAEEKGMEQGLEQGQVKERKNIIDKMVYKGKTIEEISDMLDIPVDEINKLLEV